MERKIKLFGDRVALHLVDEEYEGLLVPAPTNQKQYCLSTVVAVGDPAEEIKVGDIVFWQNNGIIERNCRYVLNGKFLFVLARSNLVARLSGRKVKLKDFQILGDYCLVKRVIEQPSKLIHVPSSVQETNPEMIVKFYVEQNGSTTDLDLKKGQEVMVDRNAANPLKIEGQDFCYVHKNYVVGTLD